MNIYDIYNTYVRGSDGFCEAVSTHCGYDISHHEIEKIAFDAETPEEFEYTLWCEDWWLVDHYNGHK